ncbi:heterokaryon incompatibility protein-domain-containing protein [Melanogaster broomeanus]|nr:heterokaryon incompatibility protein-domain-containing protein [Melanogaster broomeanus]
MTDKYSHQPLQPGEIRLVELHPSPARRKLIRRIEHFSLADAPAYTTLSYYWGNPALTETVDCDEPHSYLNITKNLRAALSSVAASAKTASKKKDTAHQRVFVWADGICINQQDTKERNEQVKIMKDIYERAEGVHIWLGDDEEKDTLKAFDLIQKLIRASELHPASEHKHSVAHMIDLRQRAEFFGLTPTWDNILFVEDATVAFIDLLERPWFQRIWVVQELAVSRNSHLYCAKSSVDWDILIQAVRYSMAVHLRPVENFGRRLALKLAETRESYQRSPEVHNPGSQGEALQGLLFRHHDWSSTEAVDMIYALRGLSSDVDDLGVVVDYDIRTETSYIRLACNILRRDGNLDILAACHRNPDSTSSLVLPSWVPDWSTKGKHTPLRHQGTSLEAYVHFAAAGNHTHCFPQFFDDNSTIQELDKRGILLDGFIIDEIMELSPPPEMGVLPKETPNVLRDFFSYYYGRYIIYAKIEKLFSLRSRNVRYFTGESMFDVYWQTTVAGCMQPEGYDTLREFFHDPQNAGNWRVTVPFWLPPMWLFIVFYIVMALWNALIVLLLCCICQYHRRKQKHRVNTAVTEKLAHIRSSQWTFAKTEMGYVGLVPRSAQLGDTIGLFKGGKVPLVLRPLKEHDESWRLVGECYVHGIMQGSAFDESRCKRIKVY